MEIMTIKSAIKSTRKFYLDAYDPDDPKLNLKYTKEELAPDKLLRRIRMQRSHITFGRHTIDHTASGWTQTKPHRQTSYIALKRRVSHDDHATYRKMSLRTPKTTPYSDNSPWPNSSKCSSRRGSKAVESRAHSKMSSKEKLQDFPVFRYKDRHDKIHKLDHTAINRFNAAVMNRLIEENIRLLTHRHDPEKLNDELDHDNFANKLFFQKEKTDVIDDDMRKTSPSFHFIHNHKNGTSTTRDITTYTPMKDPTLSKINISFKGVTDPTSFEKCKHTPRHDLIEECTISHKPRQQSTQGRTKSAGANVPKYSHCKNEKTQKSHKNETPVQQPVAAFSSFPVHAERSYAREERSLIESPSLPPDTAFGGFVASRLDLLESIRDCVRDMLNERSNPEWKREYHISNTKLADSTMQVPFNTPCHSDEFDVSAFQVISDDKIYFTRSKSADTLADGVDLSPTKGTLKERAHKTSSANNRLAGIRHNSPICVSSGELPHIVRPPKCTSSEIHYDYCGMVQPNKSSEDKYTCDPASVKTSYFEFNPPLPGMKLSSRESVMLKDDVFKNSLHCLPSHHGVLKAIPRESSSKHVETKLSVDNTRREKVHKVNKHTNNGHAKEDVSHINDKWTGFVATSNSSKLIKDVRGLAVLDLGLTINLHGKRKHNTKKRRCTIGSITYRHS